MMIRIKTSVLLVVASATSTIPVPADKKVIHIANISRLFPAIHELQPGAILLDYDYLDADTEKVLRRLAANPFYDKIKISCYKFAPNSKVDGLLKVLGVHQFIYAGDVAQQPKQKNSALKALNEILQTSMTGNLVDAGY